MRDTLEDKPETQWDNLLARPPMFQFALCAHSSPKTVLAASKLANSSLAINASESPSPFSFKGYLSYFEGFGLEITYIKPMQIINITLLSSDLEYLLISLESQKQSLEITALSHNEVLTLAKQATEGFILLGIQKNLIEAQLLSDRLITDKSIERHLKCYFEHLFKDLHIANNHHASLSALKRFRQQLSGLISQQYSPAKCINCLINTNDTPASLKSAIHFIQTHLGWEFSPQTLAKKVNMSERNLYYQFKRYTKTSPYQFHLRSRLLKVREQIISQSGYDETIAYHAVNSGFFHLSRFSSLYKENFGELPSNTKYKRAMLAED